MPSNSNKENKIGNFTVKLPETIRLSGEWEMSMREFNYTRSWYNIGNAGDAHIAFLNYPTAPSQTDLAIPLNNYDTPHQLMNAIHFAVSQHFLKTYSNTDQRIKRASNKTKKTAGSKKTKNNNTKTRNPTSADTTNSTTATKAKPNTTKTRLPTSADTTNSTTATKAKENATKTRLPTSADKTNSTTATKAKQNATKTRKTTSAKASNSTSKKAKQYTKTTPKFPTKTSELTADEIVLLPKKTIDAKKLRKPNFNLFFDSTLGKSVFKNDQHMFYLVTSDKIGYMLGFENGKINYMSEYLDGSQYSVAPYPPDMNAGMYALMVHCDLVAPQLVGNTYANLLRMVPVVGVFNETITNIYNDEQYVPVLKKTFDSIEININDDTGKIVNFLYGRTFVTLHFRKRRKWVV